MDVVEKVALLPCPIGCDGKPEITWNAGVCCVYCPVCERDGDIAWNEAEAVSLWNRRPKSAAAITTAYHAHLIAAAQDKRVLEAGLSAYDASEKSRTATGRRADMQAAYLAMLAEAREIVL